MIEEIDQSRDGGRKCLRIDTNETVQAVCQHPCLPAGIRIALEGPVSWQKRNELKVGAGLRSIPAFAAALMAWGAVAVSDSEEPLSDFMARGGALGKLTALLIPLDVPGRVWGESHVSRTSADIPIVSAIAVVDLSSNVVERGRLVLCGVWEESVRLAKCSDKLAGSPLNPAAIEKTVSALAGEINPRSNFLGSVEYRQAMAQETARRALEICLRGGSAV